MKQRNTPVCCSSFMQRKLLQIAYFSFRYEVLIWKFELIGVPSRLSQTHSYSTSKCQSKLFISSITFISVIFILTVLIRLLEWEAFGFCRDAEEPLCLTWLLLVVFSVPLLLWRWVEWGIPESRFYSKIPEVSGLVELSVAESHNRVSE